MENHGEGVAPNPIILNLETMFRRYAHHVVWVRYAWTHGVDEAVEEAFRTYAYPNLFDRMCYSTDEETYDNISRNLDTMMRNVVEAFRPMNPFRFDCLERGLIFVAWLIKSKEIILRNMANLSGDNVTRAWLEMTAWFIIIWSRGGTHVEPIKESARAVEFRKQVRKMKDHLGVFNVTPDGSDTRFRETGISQRPKKWEENDVDINITHCGIIILNYFTIDHLRVKRPSTLLRCAQTVVALCDAEVAGGQRVHLGEYVDVEALCHRLTVPFAFPVFMVWQGGYDVLKHCPLALIRPAVLPYGLSLLSFPVTATPPSIVLGDSAAGVKCSDQIAGERAALYPLAAMPKIIIYKILSMGIKKVKQGEMHL
ncbi:hypothetical protein F52700_11871 [Fusarium sp. NRRL 52700]|nr:hypothetical protein F52700_11871 [Fusarium sp. NRRL 52700]